MPYLITHRSHKQPRQSIMKKFMEKEKPHKCGLGGGARNGAKSEVAVALNSPLDGPAPARGTPPAHRGSAGPVLHAYISIILHL